MKEEFFEDIDDEVGFSDLDYAVANQCVAIYSEDKYIGTGLLIDNSGIFVSVGHNFKDTTQTHFAYYDSSSYKIDIILNEYNQDNCQDFFIGKLEGCPNLKVQITPFSSTESLKHGDYLKACGYKSKKLLIEPIIKDINLSDGIAVNQYLASIKILSREEWLKISYNQYSPRATSTKYQYIDIDTKSFGGLSGGPVYSEVGILGLLVGNVFLPSEYILSKIREHIKK